MNDPQPPPSPPPLPPDSFDSHRAVSAAASKFIRPVGLVFFSLGVALAFATAFSWATWNVLGVHAWTPLRLFEIGWVVATFGFGALALRLKRARLAVAIGACAVTLVGGAAAHGMGLAIEKVARSSRSKAALPRQLAAAADQYYLENGVNSVEYDQLVGPKCYIRAYHNVDGENPRAMCPLVDFHPVFSVRISDGTIASYSQLEGRDDFAPRFAPAEPFYPPGPTPPADGIYRRVLTDGTRQEVSYREGVPHGAFRCYYPDGRLCGELFYDDGLPVGAKPKPRPTGPLSGDAAKFAWQAEYTRAQNHYYTGDYPGAIVRLDRALAISDRLPKVFELRGRAKWGSGQYLAALADYWRGAAARRSLSDTEMDERR